MSHLCVRVCPPEFLVGQYWAAVCDSQASAELIKANLANAESF